MKKSIVILLGLLLLGVGLVSAVCTDSDGSNTAYTVKGTASLSNGSMLTDSCQSSTNLLEYGCRSTGSGINNDLITINVACSTLGSNYICASGVCKPGVKRPASEYFSEGSTLPWILAGVGVLLLVGVAYWHFKGTKPSKRRNR